MRGRADVVRELIRARPESFKVLDKGETVLHFCVKYNQMQTLKMLVEVVDDKNEILNSRDCNTGNTILHLAVMLKQTEVPAFTSWNQDLSKCREQDGFYSFDCLGAQPK